MGQRVELQAILEAILGSRNVYFQPPANVSLKYPCIVYHRDTARTAFADNKPYRTSKRYKITVIDRDPDSLVPDKVAQLETCTHSTFFTASNLNHDVYNVYF